MLPSQVDSGGPVAAHAAVAIGQLCAGPNRLACAAAVRAGVVPRLMQMAVTAERDAEAGAALRGLALLADGHTVVTRERILCDPESVRWHDQAEVPMSRRKHRPWETCSRCISCQLVAALAEAAVGHRMLVDLGAARAAAVGLVAALCKGSSANQLRLGTASAVASSSPEVQELSVASGGRRIRLVDGLVELLQPTVQRADAPRDHAHKEHANAAWLQESWAMAKAPGRGVPTREPAYRRRDEGLEGVREQLDERDRRHAAVGLALRRLCEGMEANKQGECAQQLFLSLPFAAFPRRRVPVFAAFRSLTELLRYCLSPRSTDFSLPFMVVLLLRSQRCSRRTPQWRWLTRWRWRLARPPRPRWPKRWPPWRTTRRRARAC